MKFKVIIHEAEEADFWAKVPALPGCFSQAETNDEMHANIREAIECHGTPRDGGAGSSQTWAGVEGTIK